MRHAGETVALLFSGIHFLVGDTWFKSIAYQALLYPFIHKKVYAYKYTFMYLASMMFKFQGFLSCQNVFLLQFY